jgi:hypothetical protein
VSKPFIKTIIYIVSKDILIAVLYFLLMKYNLTDETYSQQMINDFPEAPKMTLPGMIGASLFIIWLPMLIDVVVILIIQNLLLNSAKFGKLGNFFLGVVLNIPIFFISAVLYNNSIELNIALKISIIASFLFAGLIWALLFNLKSKPERNIQQV